MVQTFNKKPMYSSDIKRNRNHLPAFVVFVFCFLSSSYFLQAQVKGPEETVVTISVKDEPLHKVLASIEKQTSFRFAYNSELILQQKNITINAVKMKLHDLLNSLLDGTSIIYKITGNQIVLQKYIPERVTISGYIRDKKSGESLIGTSIYLPDMKTGVASNSYGFYSLTVPETDSLELQISYVGYKTTGIKINGHKSALLNFYLGQKEDSISPILILKDNREDNIKKNQVGLTDLSGDILTTGTAVTGHGDVISSMQLSAGVQAGLDGTAGYFVRGGNADQNQVLLDEATLYNPSHLFGLVSVFNSSAIKNANLIKGGFPAVYGDYLSSVLDVHMKDGSNQQFGGEVLLGTIASSVELHGPLSSDKSSFLLAARRSVIDWTLHPFSPGNFFTNYYFYDVNGKMNFRLSDKNKIFVSYYRGSDKGSYITDMDDDDDEKINYKIAFGNQAFDIRWNHLFSKKLFSNTSAIYSNYYQHLSSIQQDYFAQLYSGIRDINFRSDLYYYPNIKHKVRGGINYLLQSVFPATVSNKLSSTGFIAIQQSDIPEKTHNRFAAYVSDDIKAGNKLNIYIGARIPVFFKPDISYVDIEPRLSFLHLLGSTSSVKIAYARMHQYIHLVQSYNASFPAEVWIGSSNFVRPQASHQVSAGVYKNLAENMYQASLEFYYKLMDNQMLFKGGTSATIDNDIESNLIFGKGWSYGTEFVMRKNKGNFNGWLSYSLSHAYQQFDSLNQRLKFLSANNRKHNFYLSASYNLNTHWTFAANLFLTSGRAVTFNTNPSPPSSGSQDDNPLFEDDDDNSSSSSSEPNNYRLTPYSRLDLGIGYKNTRYNKDRKWETEWRLSVYNVYAHQNTYFAYRSIDPVTRQASINQISFIPVIPSLAFSLKF